MKHLFIIGNAFDSILHCLPTEYTDFRSFIISRYPRAEEYMYTVPETIIMPDGDEVLDMEDAARYIVHVIDECDAVKWTSLEKYLGCSIFDIFHSDLESVDFYDSDKEVKHAIYNNEELSHDIRLTFKYIKRLFFEWVDEELKTICLSDVWKEDVYDVLREGDGFLTFNYTKTLEEGYGINSEKICHIHGKVGDEYEQIFFGHGEMIEYEDDRENPVLWADSLGADSNLIELKMELLKDTNKALENNIDFFEDMSEVESIHSFGFGFGEVDMVYIEEIANRVNLGNVKWYINKYDRDYTNIPGKLKELGFQVEVDTRW